MATAIADLKESLKANSEQLESIRKSTLGMSNGIKSLVKLQTEINKDGRKKRYEEARESIKDKKKEARDATEKVAKGTSSSGKWGGGGLFGGLGSLFKGLKSFGWAKWLAALGVGLMFEKEIKAVFSWMGKQVKNYWDNTLGDALNKLAQAITPDWLKELMFSTDEDELNIGASSVGIKVRAAWDMLTDAVMGIVNFFGDLDTKIGGWFGLEDGLVGTAWKNLVKYIGNVGEGIRQFGVDLGVLKETGHPSGGTTTELTTGGVGLIAGLGALLTAVMGMEKLLSLPFRLTGAVLTGSLWALKIAASGAAVILGGLLEAGVIVGAGGLGLALTGAAGGLLSLATMAKEGGFIQNRLLGMASASEKVGNFFKNMIKPSTAAGPPSARRPGMLRSAFGAAGRGAMAIARGALMAGATLAPMVGAVVSALTPLLGAMALAVMSAITIYGVWKIISGSFAAREEQKAARQEAWIAKIIEKNTPSGRAASIAIGKENVAALDPNYVKNELEKAGKANKDITKAELEQVRKEAEARVVAAKLNVDAISHVVDGQRDAAMMTLHGIGSAKGQTKWRGMFKGLGRESKTKMQNWIKANPGEKITPEVLEAAGITFTGKDQKIGNKTIGSKQFMDAMTNVGLSQAMEDLLGAKSITGHSGTNVIAKSYEAALKDKNTSITYKDAILRQQEQKIKQSMTSSANPIIYYPDDGMVPYIKELIELAKLTAVNTGATAAKTGDGSSSPVTQIVKGGRGYAHRMFNLGGVGGVLPD